VFSVHTKANAHTRPVGISLFFAIFVLLFRAFTAVADLIVQRWGSWRAPACSGARWL